MTTSSFLSLCYKVKLTNADLHIMTIGDCVDYIDDYLSDSKSTKQERSKATVRQATQADYDAF